MRSRLLVAGLLLAASQWSCGSSIPGSAGAAGAGGTGTGGGAAGMSGGGAGTSGAAAGTSGGGAGTSGGAAGTSGGAAGTSGGAAGTSGGTAGTGAGGSSGGTVASGGRGGAGGGAGAGGSGGAGGRAGAGGSAGTGGAAAAGSGGRGGAGGGAGRGGTGGTSAADGGVDRMDGGGSDAATAFNPCPAAGTSCMIMPLGDSITYGVGSSGSGGGYRVPLFQQSVTGAELITFVGRNVNGPTTVAGKTFPRGHEGYSGYTIDDAPSVSRTGISPLVDAAISMFHPHIVLLMIGTNDVNLSNDLTNAPTRLGALLDRITTDAPNALLVVAKLTPTTNDTTNPRVQTYNNAIPGLVASRVSAGKHIVSVDMYAAFTANASYKTAIMYDELHPNDAGYVIMGQTWYDAIKGYLR